MSRPRASGAGAALRVLVLAHMDPRLSRGGAEIAAHQLYAELKSRAGIEAWFLSCAPGKLPVRDGVVFVQPFGANNFVYNSEAQRRFDHFNFANGDERLPSELATLLEEIRPDVVHLHHYTNFGMEVLHTIRTVVPDARIVLTLHEYLAICNHYGQMVKRPSFALCEKSGPLECHGCFPERSPQDFFLRELFAKRFLRIVDQFIAPSRFLAQRYIEWGLPAERIAVIENGVPQVEQRGREPYPGFEDGATFGFFGQISRLKGVNVLIDAAEQLAKDDLPIRLVVHGDAASQPEEFQRDFAQRIGQAPPNLRYEGAYENSRVDALMQSVHAVLVPSIWWENSPLVIQEALANRRPVICSDIGGMAEKVADGVNGFHFRAGSGWALAALLRRLARDPALLTAAHRAITPPPGIAETTDQLLALYGAGAEVGSLR